MSKSRSKDTNNEEQSVPNGQLSNFSNSTSQQSTSHENKQSTSNKHFLNENERTSTSTNLTESDSVEQTPRSSYSNNEVEISAPSEQFLNENEHTITSTNLTESDFVEETTRSSHPNDKMENNELEISAASEHFLNEAELDQGTLKGSNTVEQYRFRASQRKDETGENDSAASGFERFKYLVQSNGGKKDAEENEKDDQESNSENE